MELECRLPGTWLGRKLGMPHTPIGHASQSTVALLRAVKRKQQERTGQILAGFYLELACDTPILEAIQGSQPSPFAQVSQFLTFAPHDDQRLAKAMRNPTKKSAFAFGGKYNLGGGGDRISMGDIYLFPHKSAARGTFKRKFGFSFTRKWFVMRVRQMHDILDFLHAHDFTLELKKHCQCCPLTPFYLPHDVAGHLVIDSMEEGNLFDLSASSNPDNAAIMKLKQHIELQECWLKLAERARFDLTNVELPLYRI